MYKIFVIGIQVFSLFLMHWFQPERVSVESDAPQHMAPGEEAIVTVTIDKTNIKGFAKFQLEFSDGLVAESEETAGASFTFHDGIAKFIWLSLPGDDIFTLQYRLVADEDFQGWGSIKGTFSYIHENQRYNHEAPEVIIQVGEAGERPTADASDGNGKFTPVATRTLTAENANQWKVVVEIDKADMGGFAKVEENIPAGFTAVDMKSSSAVFTSDGNTVKYVWYDIPRRDKVTVIYKLLPVIAMDGGEPEINGDFAYLDEDITRMVMINDKGYVPPAEPEEPRDTSGADVMDVIALNDTDEDDAEEEEKEEAPAPEPITESSDIDETATAEVPVTAQPKTEPTTTEKAYVDANIVDVPAPEKGIFYRVQIAAGKNNLSNDTFAKLYDFQEGFKLETLGGLFKYTTGHHTVYKQARNDRERITGKYDKFKGPFVTAYNDGERITVQEALLISQQNWVP